MAELREHPRLSGPGRNGRSRGEGTVKALMLILQVVLTVVIVVSVLPVVLVAVPPLREGRLGLVALGVMLVCTFGFVRLVWPRRAS